jgi:hypothetical protein
MAVQSRNNAVGIQRQDAKLPRRKNLEASACRLGSLPLNDEESRISDKIFQPRKNAQNTKGKVFSVLFVLSCGYSFGCGDSRALFIRVHPWLNCHSKIIRPLATLRTRPGLIAIRGSYP